MVISNNFYSKIKTKILFLAQIAVLAYCKKICTASRDKNASGIKSRKFKVKSAVHAVTHFL